MPVHWATTQNNLGTALRAQSERTGSEAGLALLGEAAAAFRLALQVYTAEHFGYQHPIVMRSLTQVEALIAERRR